MTIRQLLALAATAAALAACGSGMVTTDASNGADPLDQTRKHDAGAGGACNYAPPGTAACCRSGQGCYGTYWCNTSSCSCENVSNPCGSAADAGTPPPPPPPAPDAGTGGSCTYDPPGTADCCRSGQGCYGTYWCNTSSCSCENVSNPCGSSSDAGAPPPPPPADAGAPPPPPPADAGSPPPPPPPPSGSVGPNGGSVTLLHFGMTGDTRPPSCNATTSYPTPIIDAIADAFTAKQVQFALDLGDHMFACSGNASAAQTQMQDYVTATQRYSGTWFMTMGNHECESSTCLPGSSDVNFSAYMGALARTEPWYSVDVQTSLGLARFVFVADNAWGPQQQSWLTAVLADADANAKYTIVARHHPASNTQVASQIIQTIRAHKFALLLTGHTHVYNHPTDDNGRDIVIGTGGAPLNTTATGQYFNGYALVDQLSNGNLQISVYDSSNGSLMDQWSAGPN